MPATSKVFVRNRALGYVTNHIPMVVRYIQRRKENLIVTCTGRAIHTYGVSHFTLLSVSPSHGTITCMAGDTYHVYTAADKVIYAWRRGCELVHTYKGHTQPIHLLLPFGAHLISVDEESTFKVWDVKAESESLELSFSNDVFQIMSIAHPATYINKILLGSSQGEMQLWNIRTSKLIYTFQGWGSSVNVLEQAPALDVMGIGLEDGRIILHNLKLDQTVMTFTQDWGPVTALSFRTDDNPIMVSGTHKGHIVLWDLENRKVKTQIWKAHCKTVAGINCLSSEPLMVTSSPDNSLKLWIFDMPDGSARMLRLREGHMAPPTHIRFHGDDGYNVLSAGEDSTLRIFSTKTETFNKSLGRASYNRKVTKKKGLLRDTLKMPPITQFTTETTREKEWDGIAAIHRGIPEVTTWSYDKLKMGDGNLLPDRFKRKAEREVGSSTRFTATSLCLTHCGNFVIIGYSSGHIDRFNIQSGLHRLEYGAPLAHNGAVRGLATDGLNHRVISGGSDSCIKFWHFKDKGRPPLHTIQLDESISFFVAHTESAMLAVALEDLTIIIMDIESHSIVRKFVGHTSKVTDATFSPDSRWLISSSMDCTIRTWDIPSSQLIDIFEVEEPCTSLTISPTGHFLATSHLDLLGIYLWSNRTLFTHVSLRPVKSEAEVPLMEFPGSRTDENQESPVEDVMLDDNDDSAEVASPDQLADHLVTLSLLPSSRWQNLLQINVVKKRNKPKEPPKAPKAAPFFLPTLPTLEMQFDLSEVTSKKDNETRVIDLNAMQNLTIFGRTLEQCDPDYFSAFNKLKEMSPAAIDFEINALSPLSGGSTYLMLKFTKMIESVLKSNRDFELAQSYLGLFLKTHAEFITTQPKLLAALDTLQTCQIESWDALAEKLMYNLSVINFVKAM